MRVTKQDIALIQLEQSIHLLMDEKDDISAISLAGASEEILGAIVESNGMESAYKSDHRFTSEISEIMDDRKSSYEDIKEVLVGIRNGLKHFRNEDYMDHDFHFAAIVLIGRAVRNLKLLGLKETDRISRFIDYETIYYS